MKSKQPMFEDYLVEALITAIRGDKANIADMIAGAEARAGYRLVRPGEATWLPLWDWKPQSVCSIDERTARLVLLDAITPGQGAFTRLVDALALAKLAPRVISPTREFQAILRRKGWQRAPPCHARQQADIWSPPHLEGSDAP